MAFVNLSLLLGGLLTAIPVVLHLVMRQQPKRLMFPAMQFLRQRRETNQRKLQLKHWLLLALRCGAIVLLALAFARPSVVSAVAGQWMLIVLVGAGLLVVAGLTIVSIVQRKGRLLVGALAAITLASVVAFAAMIVGLVNQNAGVLLGDEQAPVAAVMIFDTSPHMEYRYQNQTRSDIAQEMGNWLIGQFPPDSEVAVLDSRQSPAVFAVDLASARKSIDRLQVTEVSEPLPSVVSKGLNLLASSEKTRKEVYLFTDLASSAWKDPTGSLAKTLEASANVSLYVVDVGVVDPSNVALGPLRLSSESLAKSNELRISTQVQSLGATGPQVIELLLEDYDPTLPIIVDGETKVPELRTRGREEVTLTAGESQQVAFRLRGLETGVHHGIVRLSGGDGLDADNRRHFVVEVKDAWPMLVSLLKTRQHRCSPKPLPPSSSSKPGRRASHVPPSRNRAWQIVTWRITRRCVCWTPSRFRRSCGSSLASMSVLAADWLFFWDTMPKQRLRSTSQQHNNCSPANWRGSGDLRIEVYFSLRIDTTIPCWLNSAVARPACLGTPRRSSNIGCLIR